MRLLSGPVAIFVMVVSVVSCGGGPSKSSFLVKADAICQQGNDVVTVLTTPSEYAQIADFASKLADSTTATVQRLRKLSFPAGKNGKEAKSWIADLEAAAQSTRRIPETVTKTDYAATEAAATDASGRFKTADDHARLYGSSQCGKAHVVASGNLSQTAPATGKKAYIARVDALCKKANAQDNNSTAPQTLAEVKALLDKSLSVNEKLLSDIRAIPEPGLDKVQLDATISAFEQSVATARDVQSAAKSGDERKTMQLLDQLGQVTSSADSKADAYGFKDCGSQG